MKPKRKAAPARGRNKPGTEAPKSYHHGDLAQALRDAALDAILRDGTDALNLRDLARRVGVSPAAPYRHYADKSALLRAVAAEIGARLDAEVARTRAEAPPDALEQFRALGIALVRFAVRYPAHFRVMNMPGMGGFAPTEEERELLRQAQARGEIAACPVDDIALAASSLIYGLCRLIVDGALDEHPISEARADELAIAVTGVLGHGIVPRHVSQQPCPE